MTSEISEDEAALYDRQIRLWGLDSQKRLRASRILLVGLGGLGAEVAKNIILAGVNSVTLLDNQNVSEDDLCCQFLVTADDTSKNRAECSLSQAQQLNPMVAVTVDTEAITSKTKDFFSNFDVVILTKCSKAEMIRVNEICRQSSIKFFAGDVCGYFGYSFTDLIEHKFAEEKLINIQIKQDSDAPKTIQETKVEQKTISFVSLKKAFDTDWNAEKNAKQLKTLSSSYFILQCLLNFRSLHSRSPLRNRRNQDTSELVRLRDELLESMGVSKDRLDDTFASAVFAELSPVCAIVGGMLAQEVVKAVSCKDRPFNNFFFFNGLNDNGVVEMIGC